ncbi:MAG: NnrS family protein [Pseudolabrys sp.]
MSTPAALQRRRDYDGPALFSYGFRPFFLAAGLWAVIGILVWIPQYMGTLSVPTHFTPLDWHIHEMLYGYVAAAIAGFLLTAIPNWTGRLPVNGWPLAGLAALWLAGRLALLISAQLGGLVAAIIDTAFLVTLAVVAGREIVVGENWRNLRVLGVLVALVLGNIVFHVEVLMTGTADYGTRIAIAAVILMISLIGGRIVPSFTNNWLARNNPGRMPVPFSQFDLVTLVVSVFALVAWIITPMHWLSAVLLIVAGCLQAVRLARWAGDRTVADRLVLILHIGYAFVPLGFVMIGLAAFIPDVPATTGIHAWTAGAIGLMTAAVMTRATLGHTGQPLQAGRATQAIYALLLAAALVRIVAAFMGSVDLLEFAGLCWTAAFILFVLLYGPLLATRSPGWAETHR